MIKIIQPAKAKFYKVECHYCKCVFSYQDEDKEQQPQRHKHPFGIYVKCPECGERYWIKKYYMAEGWSNGCK